MKVVLFCGGQGMRLREFSERIPKPMVPIGYRPILWYIMKYYAHYGHKDFVLCLGYQGDVIKNYFVNYNEYTSNDFVYAKGGNYVNLINKDIEDWTITFADTGINATLGERLLAVEKYLDGEECFLANYSDALTDLPLDKMVDDFHARGKSGMFMVTQPTRSFHVVKLNEGNKDVKEITTLANSGLWVNAGYFIFNRSIFDYLQPGEDLVDDALPKLLRRDQLSAYTFNGTWIPMDTFKEKQMLDDMHSKGDTPWEVWKKKTNRLKVPA
ncbi:MAG TPA: sugar phosphate nucleotidyltransferase [Cyclobacteriaceae bacterium]|nr:sugar phosphate nucleotidyltransferase [Cyclobacteriaceae bacterium]